MIKRLLILAAAVAALRLTGLLPFETKDVASLKPVEALVVSVEEETLVLDGGECQGRGKTWEEALADLKEGADGDVFLGTAEQVVLCGAAWKFLPQMVGSDELRPAAVVCACNGEVKQEEAARYLSAHNAGLTLQQVRAALLRGETVKLPVLRMTEGGLRLDGSEDR